MQKIKLALDWTPNVNHLGLLVAQEKGYYLELGLDVEITDPSADNYAITPAKQVELGLADFALCPTESVISYRTKNKPFDMIAVAAILQEDLSAIVVKNNSGIVSPKDLDGKIYSSYKARYEDGIVKAMIRNDGGLGNLQITYPDKLGIWDTLLSGTADATWIFLNWEGVAAINHKDELRYFKMSDYGIPYSYSPVIAACESKMNERLEAYKSFMAASKKGFLYSQQNLEASADILSKYVPESDKNINLIEAVKATASSFGNANTWGVMKEEVIADFINWIKSEGLEDRAINMSEIMTNNCLE